MLATTAASGEAGHGGEALRRRGQAAAPEAPGAPENSRQGSFEHVSSYMTKCVCVLFWGGVVEKCWNPSFLELELVRT